MAPKRGSTIYIPIIVPENWQLASSLVCGVLGLVCLIFALVTSNWNVTTIGIPETDLSYPITATLKWGLRSIHVKWCITRPHYPPSNNNNNNAATSAATPTSFLTNCASEDIVYSHCKSSDGYWCSNAADPILSFWLIIASCVGLLVSTFFALSRRLFQPVGYSVCVIACSVAIIIFRGCQVVFEPAGQLLDWIEKGTSETNQGSSYYVMTAGTFILLLGMLLASWGAYRVAQRGHETAPSTVDQPTQQQQQQQTANPTASADVTAQQQTSQFQHSERVLSVIASAPNRLQDPSSSLAAKGVGVTDDASTTSASKNATSNLRRSAIDNDGMDFEAVNEPSAVAMSTIPSSSASLATNANSVTTTAATAAVAVTTADNAVREGSAAAGGGGGALSFLDDDSPPIVPASPSQPRAPSQ